jgi:hypothetical protein
MLKEQEPIRFLLKILNFYGVWELKTLRKFHQSLAVVAFILFQLLSTVLVLFSLVQVQGAAKMALAISFSCTYLMSIGYSISFLVFEGAIKDLLTDLDQTLSDHPDSNHFINNALHGWRRYERKKIFGLAVCIAFGIVGSFTSGELSVPMWSPQMLTESSFAFSFWWTFQSLNLLHMPLLTFVIQDTLNGLLMIINAFSKFCRFELKILVLTGGDSKKRLIEAVKMHQSLQR